LFFRYYLSRVEIFSESAYNALLPNEDEKDYVPLESASPGFQARKPGPVKETEGSLYGIFQLLFVPAVSVFLTFTVTIGVFPAIVVLIESQDKCISSNRFHNDLFLPVLFVLYNLCDFCGRISAEYFTPLLNKGNMLQFSVFRFVFIPLILLCNISNSKLPIVFVNDAFPIIIVCAFAFTNGYLASCAMMLGPTLVSARDAGVAGTIMIFSLTLGLLGGGSLSFVALYISQGSV